MKLTDLFPHELIGSELKAGKLRYTSQVTFMYRRPLNT